MTTRQVSRNRTTPARLQPLAQGLSVALAAAYLVLFVLVRSAERTAPENTFGAYLFLFIAYAACAVALVVRPTLGVYLAAATLQVIVLGLFVVFGLGLLGPGVFSYDAVRDLHMSVWALVITVAQLVLFGVLARLAGVRVGR